MKTKLFIDFDNTLFNTDCLKDDLFGVYKELGFSNAEILATYKTTCEDYNYSPLKHLQALHQIRSFDMEKAISDIDKLYVKTPQYLFADTKSFLDNLDRNKYEVNLLTLGDMDFQMKKTESSGINKSFDNIYCCQNQKWIYLKTLVEPDEKFYLIDDRSDTVFETSKGFKEGVTIEVNRTAKPLDNMEKPAPYTGIKIKSLNEAEKYL